MEMLLEPEILLENDAEAESYMQSVDSLMDVNLQEQDLTANDDEEREKSLSPLPDNANVAYKTNSMRIEPEELRFFKQKFSDLNQAKLIRAHCTVCDIHMGTAPSEQSQRFQHPMLRVLLCEPCFTFYTSGEFEKDQDGSELYCRWCGQGGQVYCCSKCPFVFCKKCIRRNLSASMIRHIENIDDWVCYSCSPADLWNLRADCWALQKYSQRQMANEHVIGPEALTLDTSVCCQTEKPAPKSKAKVRSIKKKPEDEEYNPILSGLGLEKVKKNIKRSGSPLTNGAKRQISNEQEVVCTPDVAFSFPVPTAQINTSSITITSKQPSSFLKVKSPAQLMDPIKTNNRLQSIKPELSKASPSNRVYIQSSNTQQPMTIYVNDNQLYTQQTQQKTTNRQKILPKTTQHTDAMLEESPLFTSMQSLERLNPPSGFKITDMSWFDDNLAGAEKAINDFNIVMNNFVRETRSQMIEQADQMRNEFILRIQATINNLEKLKAKINTDHKSWKIFMMTTPKPNTIAIDPTPHFAARRPAYQRNTPTIVTTPKQLTRVQGAIATTSKITAVRPPKPIISRALNNPKKVLTVNDSDSDSDCMIIADEERAQRNKTKSMDNGVGDLLIEDKDAPPRKDDVRPNTIPGGVKRRKPGPKSITRKYDDHNVQIQDEQNDVEIANEASEINVNEFNPEGNAENVNVVQEENEEENEANVSEDDEDDLSALGADLAKIRQALNDSIRDNPEETKDDKNKEKEDKNDHTKPEECNGDNEKDESKPRDGEYKNDQNTSDPLASETNTTTTEVVDMSIVTSEKTNANSTEVVDETLENLEAESSLTDDLPSGLAVLKDLAEKCIPPATDLL